MKNIYMFVFLIIELMTTYAFAENDAVPSSGSCGDNCQWRVNLETKELVVERADSSVATGQIQNYTRTCTTETCVVASPWFAYKNDITSLKIGEGITSIGEYAFERMASLSNVEFPESLLSIGRQSFHNCKALASVDIPDTVTTIGASAFSQSGLTSVELPESLTSVGRRSFADTAIGAQGIVIPDGLTKDKIGDGTVFSGTSIRFLYCTSSSMAQCEQIAAATGTEAVQYSVNEDGSFSIDANTYLTVSDMQNGYACGNADTCAAVKAAYQTGLPIRIGSKEYASIKDLNAGDYLKHRIYSVEEAARISGKKNKVMIRYK